MGQGTKSLRDSPLRRVLADTARTAAISTITVFRTAGSIKSRQILSNLSTSSISRTVEQRPRLRTC